MKGILVVSGYLILGLLSLISGISILKKKNCKPGENIEWKLLLKKTDILSGSLIMIGVMLLSSLLLVLVFNLFKIHTS